MRWLFPSLQGYQRGWLRGDLIAGLTVWAVLVPEALAYATIAGVSPVVGLYAAPGALLLYAAFGSSRHLVTGPMSATAALSAATVADVVTGLARTRAITHPKSPRRTQPSCSPPAPTDSLKRSSRFGTAHTDPMPAQKLVAGRVAVVVVEGLAPAGTNLLG